MKRTFLPLTLFLACLFACWLSTGCATEEKRTGPAVEITQAYSGMSVALEDALKEMYSLMDDIEPGTRASRTIGSIELVGGRELSGAATGFGRPNGAGSTAGSGGTGAGAGAATRSGTEFPDSLLYLVNFDEGGFAVLSADVRLDPVLALTSAGHMKTSDFTRQPGSSGLTLEDLWVEEDEDYMLGGVTAANGAGFVGRILLDYVRGGLSRDLYDGTGGGLEEPGGGGGSGNDPRDPIVPPTPGGGGSGVTYTFHYSDWVVDEANTTRTLMTWEWRWHQESPFNDFVEFFKPADTGAGCVAIAVMQVIAHNEFPVNCRDLYYKGGDSNLKTKIAAAMTSETDTVTWAGLKASDLRSWTDTLSPAGARPAAASIALTIGKGCDTQYNFFGTGMSFSTPNQAKQYLRSLGYYADRDNGYKEADVKQSVRAGFPAIIGGISNEETETRSGSKEKGAHAWVVDGWMERSRNMERHGSDGSVTVMSTTYQKLVHCNWGWEGWCDGYYHSGVFDLSNRPTVVGDGDIDDDRNRNYDWWMRTLIIKHQ